MSKERLRASRLRVYCKRVRQRIGEHGIAKRKPAARSCVGATAAPRQHRLGPFRRTPGATARRGCEQHRAMSARPSATANSPCVAGSGEVTIERAGEVVALDEEAQRGDDVVDRDPRHRRAAVAEDGAGAEAERGQHLLERAVPRIEHDADAWMRDANAGRARRLGGRFPLGAQIGEEAVAGATRSSTTRCARRTSPIADALTNTRRLFRHDASVRARSPVDIRRLSRNSRLRLSLQRPSPTLAPARWTRRRRPRGARRRGAAGGIPRDLVVAGAARRTNRTTRCPSAESDCTAPGQSCRTRPKRRFSCAATLPQRCHRREQLSRIRTGRRPTQVKRR